MSSYKLRIHPHLSASQKNDLLNAIRLLQGVVSLDPSDGAEGDLKGMDFSNDQFANKIEPPPIPPAQNFSANSDKMNFTSNQNEMLMQAEEQKRIIAQVIKWGVYNNKITMQQLKDSSAEGAVEMAKKLIGIMPDGDREKILKG